MLVRHTLTATGTCPTTGLPDRYRITVAATRVVLCEDIASVVDSLLAGPIFQEEFTQSLADRLGCRVETRCDHLAGGRVATTCICHPRPTATFGGAPMHGMIRFDTNHGDPLVRTLRAAVAAIADREARSVGGLHLASAAGQLVVRGDEEALTALVSRLEGLGVYGPVVVEVQGDLQEADDFGLYVADRTDLVTVIAVPVEPPA